MEETRTLALLLVASIIVSLGGTIIALDKLDKFQIGITGMATDTDLGTVNLTVTELIEITFTADGLNFGSGYVNPSCDNCTTNTNSTTGASGTRDETCCLTGWATAQNDGLVMENTGNSNLSVNLETSKSPTAFLGGSSPAPQFQWIITAGSLSTVVSPTLDDTTEACGGTINNKDSWYTVNSTADGTQICSAGAFKALDAQNELVVDFRLVIPRNAPAELKTVILTATGTSS